MQIHLCIPGEPSALALMLLLRVAVFASSFFSPIEASHVYSAPARRKLHLLQEGLVITAPRQQRDTRADNNFQNSKAHM